MKKVIRKKKILVLRSDLSDLKNILYMIQTLPFIAQGWVLSFLVETCLSLVLTLS